MKGRWLELGNIEAIPLQGARVVDLPNGRVGIFRTVEGRVFAIDNRCPHLKGPLSDGIVHGNSVTCPLHSLVIDLETGKADAPEGGCVKVYPVELRGGSIFLKVNAHYCDHPA